MDEHTENVEVGKAAGLLLLLGDSDMGVTCMLCRVRLLQLVSVALGGTVGVRVIVAVVVFMSAVRVAV